MKWLKFEKKILKLTWTAARMGHPFLAARLFFELHLQYTLKALRKITQQTNTSSQRSLIDHPPKLPTTVEIGLVGLLSSEVGVGEAARGIARSILELKARTGLFDLSGLSTSRAMNTELADQLSSLLQVENIDTLILAINADHVPQALNLGVRKVFEKAKRKIGYWFWETEHFPSQWHSRITLFDSIWTSTRFIQNSIQKVSPVPVQLVLPCIKDVAQLHREPIDHQSLATALKEKRKIILTIFDGFSFSSRKNPLGTIAAFKKLCTLLPRETFHLVIKCTNISPLETAEIKVNLAGYSYSLINEYLSQNQLCFLLKNCDLFISLHRAEGLGLNLIDAMLFEKPVVATGYSGNLDFMSDENSYLVEYSLVEAKGEVGPYQGSRWAEPNAEDAAQKMVSIFTQPNIAHEKGILARKNILELYSKEKSLKSIQDALGI